MAMVVKVNELKLQISSAVATKPPSAPMLVVTIICRSKAISLPVRYHLSISMCSRIRGKPRLCMIAISSSLDQVALIPDCVDALKELSEPIYTSKGIEIHLDFMPNPLERITLLDHRMLLLRRRPFTKWP